MQFEKLTCNIGAELKDVQIRDAIDSDDLFSEIHRHLLENKVIFFRDQELTPAQHVAFASRFGALCPGGSTRTAISSAETRARSRTMPRSSPARSGAEPCRAAGSTPTSGGRGSPRAIPSSASPRIAADAR